MKKSLILSLAAGGVLIAGLSVFLGLSLSHCSHDHTEEKITKAASCEEEGTLSEICLKCHAVLATEAIAPLGHDYGEWALEDEPTRERSGLAVQICKRDETHRNEKVLPRLDEENYHYEVTVAPSCNQSGEGVYTSEEYGTYTVTLPQLDHDIVDGECALCHTILYTPGITYTLSEDETYYIVSNKNNTIKPVDIVIPAEHEGIPVKEIASEGFAYRPWINSISIPVSIERIGAGAFSQSDLKRLYYDAENCEDFNGRNWVFLPGDTNQSLEVTIGRHVKKIPARMFYPLATDPTKIPLVNRLIFESGSTLEAIGNYAFYNLDIETIEFPDTLQTIGSYAFSANESLATVRFGSGLKTIASHAFHYCIRLEETDFTNSQLRTVNDSAFRDCNSLKKVHFPDTLSSVGDAAYAYCSALADLRFANGLTALGKQAFYQCASLNVLTLPETISEIGEQCFENCAALKEIFYNAVHCEDLKSGNNVFTGAGDKNDGVKVTFGNSVEIIPARLFYSTSDSSSLIPLRDIIIQSENLKEIGNYAFFGISCNSSFAGTEEKWSFITIGTGNETLENITFANEEVL